MIDALPLLLGPEGYQISRSVRLRSSATAYLNRTPASAGNRKTWTWGGWVKRGGLPSTGYYSLFGADSGAGSSFYIAFDNSTQQLEFGQGATVYRKTTQVFRDPSSWYHLVINSDTTQATASNRLKIYVNGVQITSFATSNDPSLNGDWALNNNVAHSIGADIPNTGARNFFDGYLTELNFIDGQALTPSSFGETNAITGVWQPKKYTGTYGTNGFYLNFSDNSAATAAAIGKDYSGNGNDWTPNNISVTAGVTYDSMLDVPTQWADGGNGRGNYATWNPLDKNANGSIAGGNLNNTNGSTNNAGVRSTIALPQSGKWYAELVVNASTSSTSAIGFGFATATADMGGSVDGANKYDIYGSSTGSIFSNTTSLTSSLGAFTAGDILQVAYDGATGKAWVGKNNTWYNSSGGSTGDPANGTNQTFTLSGEFFLYSYYYNTNASLNCGQRPFSYTPPSGFRALNTLNLPTPTILKGNQYFDAVTWTGTGSNQQVALNFTSDFVWAKRRNGADSHSLYDVLRGINKDLSSNSTAAEATNDYGLDFDNGSYLDITGTKYFGGGGGGSPTFVAWNWKEGATQGFDIVTYTGDGANRTVAHNLGVAPKMVIVKKRNSATSSNWMVYHAGAGTGNALNLNGTSAAGGTYWNNTAPTSTVFSLDSNANYNNNTDTFVAYCFAAVAGYSAFGSYTGNGSADGPFVFCGFRPRWVLWKNASAVGDWQIKDSSRSTYNVTSANLYADLSNAENSAGDVDFLSNGFKLRSAGTDVNGSGNTIIYAAFAENPFKNALAR